MTYRLLERRLLTRIQPHGVTIGMWYFLRALWMENGLTQRELSWRVGATEPTTLSAIREMVRAGLVKRVANSTDRRKVNVVLTDHGAKLKDSLMPVADEFLNELRAGLTDREVDMLLQMLRVIQENATKDLEWD